MRGRFEVDTAKTFDYYLTSNCWMILRHCPQMQLVGEACGIEQNKQFKEYI